MTRHLQVSAGAVYDLGYQVVWYPKCWRPVLAGRCGELIRAKASEHGWRIGAPEIMPAHVRLFVRAHSYDSPSPIASQFKGFTSRRLRAEFALLRSRLPALWSRSYFAATVGAVPAEAVCRYIDAQNERPWRKERAR